MRISFLLHNGYHYGGTIRTTFTLAEELAARHEVEIVSVFRHRDRPILELPAGVTLRHLVDLRKDSPEYDGDHPDFHRPAEVFPRGDGRWKQYSALTDARIGEHLRGWRPTSSSPPARGSTCNWPGRPAGGRSSSARNT